jgi:hypothetical protein
VVYIHVKRELNEGHYITWLMSGHSRRGGYPCKEGAEREEIALPFSVLAV